MQELIEKRKKYFAEIDELNKEIDLKVKEYFDSKVEQLKEETKKYKEEIIVNYQKQFDFINSKIEIIDEIISEQMPEVDEIKKLINNKNEILTSDINEEELCETPCENCNEIIEEDVVCDNHKIDNSINTVICIKNEDSRPGMPQILNPR